MKPPCEMVVWYVIPAIRSELAKDLLKLGMKQKTISELMDITQPAVSQYLTDKRGSGIEFNDDVYKDGVLKINNENTIGDIVFTVEQENTRPLINIKNYLLLALIIILFNMFIIYSLLIKNNE